MVTEMETKEQTKIDEFDDKEIVEEKADDSTKTSQIKKLKYIGKLVDDMINELEPKIQPESDGSIYKDKSNFGLNFGAKHTEKKMSFGFKSPEKKSLFGSKSQENKLNFGSKHTEKKFDFGSKHVENKLNFGSKSPENKEKKFDFGSKSAGIKIIPVTGKDSQLAWKPKPKQE